MYIHICIYIHTHCLRVYCTNIVLSVRLEQPWDTQSGSLLSTSRWLLDLSVAESMPADVQLRARTFT